MKWTRTYKWLAISIAIPLLAFSFIMLNFSEPCACYTTTMELAMYVGLPYMQEPTLGDVQNGFARKFPTGIKPYEKNLLRFEEAKANYSIKKRKNAWICTYWIKSSFVAKKGYRITISLDGAGNVLGTRAVSIESWFENEMKS